MRLHEGKRDNPHPFPSWAFCSCTHLHNIWVIPVCSLNISAGSRLMETVSGWAIVLHCMLPPPTLCGWNESLMNLRSTSAPFPRHIHAVALQTPRQASLQTQPPEHAGFPHRRTLAIGCCFPFITELFLFASHKCVSYPRIFECFRSHVNSLSVYLMENTWCIMPPVKDFRSCCQQWHPRLLLKLTVSSFFHSQHSTTLILFTNFSRKSQERAVLWKSVAPKMKYVTLRQMGARTEDHRLDTA